MIFPSEGQRGHLEPENNSDSRTLYTTRLRYRWRQLHLFNMRFSSEALRPNQANTQLYTLVCFCFFLNFYSFLLDVSFFHHLQHLGHFQNLHMLLKTPKISGPSSSSVLSGAFIYLVNAKPETTCEQKESTQ